MELVHITTVGDDIAATYTASFRDYPGITRTYVFSDNTLYFRHANPEIERASFATSTLVRTVLESLWEKTKGPEKIRKKYFCPKKRCKIASRLSDNYPIIGCTTDCRYFSPS
jgi:hypothetical protein